MKQTLFLFLMAVTWQGSAPAADIYVSPTGRDSNSGAKARPLASIAAAQRLARSRKSAGAVTVWLHGGPALSVVLPLRHNSGERGGTAW